MTNTDALAPARWTASAKTPLRSSFQSVYELLRVEAPADEVRDLFKAMTKIRGAHRVELSRRPGDVVDGVWVESPWFSISFHGTARAVHGAANLLMTSGLQALDKNADHDHMRCIENARKQGVPAEWAHRVETYLSM